METIKIELTQEELQVLVQALDTHVRQHGLGVAVNAIAALQRLQTAARIQSEQLRGLEKVPA